MRLILPPPLSIAKPPPDREFAGKVSRLGCSLRPCKSVVAQGGGGAVGIMTTISKNAFFLRQAFDGDNAIEPLIGCAREGRVLRLGVGNGTSLVGGWLGELYFTMKVSSMAGLVSIGW